MRIMCAANRPAWAPGAGHGSPHRAGERRMFARGSRQIFDPRVVRRACEELGLDPAQLPGAKSRV